MTWEYDLIVEDLRCGRELEFTWNGEKMSINCHMTDDHASDQWFLSFYRTHISIESNSVDDLFQRISFDGQTFKDIFPEIEESVMF